ncbi:MAG: site-specific DNA-methyltransferase [Acidobacteriota bacterium]
MTTSIKWPKGLKPVYQNARGSLILGHCEKILADPTFRKEFQGKIQLILTSPPFPLNQKKKYGNFQGAAYLEWLSAFGPLFAEYLTPDGSVVIEIGNAWEKGSPTQSILPYQALLGFLQKGDFKLCQEITYYNPARLPTPAQWVTIERIRLKDSTTKVWWMAKTKKPKADNRKVLKPYSAAMRGLLDRGTYNAGKRPSEHQISKTGFLKEHAGAIPPNLIEAANTRSGSKYQCFCRDHGVEAHPARMPEKVAEFFIRFLTDEGDLVLDPFSGSNTTGVVADRLGRRWLSVEALPQYALSSVANFSVRRAKTLLKRFHLT